MGAGPMSQKIGRQGDVAGASASIQKAIQILQHALPDIPVGSEAHKAVMDSLTKLAKNFPAGQAPPGPGDASLRNLASQQQQGAGMAGLAKMMAGAGAQPGGGPPPSPGGAPPMAA
jgi:hypothetical protein